MTQNTELFQCSSKALGAALSLMRGAFTGRTVGVIPILSAVRIVANADGLILTGTNLTVSITLSCPAKVTTAATLFLVYADLTKLLSAFDSDRTLTFARDKWSGVVTTEGVKARIDGFDPDEFPMIPEPDELWYDVGGKELIEAIERVAPAVASKDGRQTLECLSLAMADEVIELAGIDGWRLNVERISGSVAPDAKPILIPKEVLASIGRLFDGDERIGIYSTSGTQFAFQQGERVLISSTPEGKYPDFHRLIPTESTRFFAATAGDWLRACRVASFNSTALLKVLTFEAPDGAGEIDITLKTSGAEATVHVTAGGSEPLVVKINSEHFSDLMAHLPASMLVTITVNGSASPIVARPEGIAFTHVQMPVTAGGH